MSEQYFWVNGQISHFDLNFCVFSAVFTNLKFCKQRIIAFYGESSGVLDSGLSDFFLIDLPFKTYLRMTGAVSYLQIECLGFSK